MTPGPDRPLIQSECAPVICREVTRFFGVRAAVRGVNLELPQASLTLLLGANGAGKSTLLRLLAGALQPSQGDILITGLPIRDPRARGRIGLLGHESLLQPLLTVRENLEFYAVLYGLERPGEAARRALERVRGPHLAELKCGELSQGMRQKAALARTLLHQPPVLLLDEAFASLDRATVADIRDVLRELRQAGHTILLSTHTEEFIHDLADQRIHLERGRIAAAQRPADARPPA